MKKWIWILLIMRGSVCFSNELPENVQIESINDFSGGLNTTQDASKLSNNMASYMQNVLIDEKFGSIVKRKGFIVSGSTVGLIDVRFLGVFNRENGDKEYIVSDSSSVYSTKDFTSYILLKGNLNRNLNVQGEQVRNKYWIVNGSDADFTYDGTTVVVLDGGTYSGTLTPNAPRGKYIKYYQERVFIYDENGNNSRCDYSALVDTNSLIIAPDDSRAWTVTTNNLQIGQGDGESGTALWIYRNQLRFGKDHSIYTLFGDNQFSYNPVKTEAKIGVVSNDSVVVLDGLTYFLGQDGIYSFNGLQSQRISDLIQPDIDLIKKDISRVVTNTWDSQSSFSKGSFSGSTATTSGFLQMQSSTITVLSSSNIVTGGQYDFRNGSTSTGFFAVSTITIEPTYLGYLNFLRPPSASVGFFLYGRMNLAFSTENCTANFFADIRNVRTGQQSAYTSVQGGGSQFSLAEMSPPAAPDAIIFTADDIKNSSFTMKIRVDPVSCDDQPGGNGSYVSIAAATQSAVIILQPATTIQFISEISTISSAISSWGAFSDVRNLNSGTVNYFYKAATSTVNITTYPWIPISPASIIASSITNLYIQWASTISGVSQSTPTNIDKVTIDHIEGSGSNTRSFGIGYRGRYHLFVSTVSDGSITRDLVKSKITNQNPNAWMNMTGMNFRSVLLDGNIVYGGSASSGSVIRWDFGMNDNGQPIDAIYDTGNLTLKSNFFVKNVQEYLIDIDKETNAKLTLGTSTDTFNFTNINIDLNGSGSLLKSIKGIITNAKQYKFRFRNNELEKGMTLHQFDIIYQTTQIR